MGSQGTDPNSTGPGAKAHEVAAKRRIDAQNAAKERILFPFVGRSPQMFFLEI